MGQRVLTLNRGILDGNVERNITVELRRKAWSKTDGMRTASNEGCTPLYPIDEFATNAGVAIMGQQVGNSIEARNALATSIHGSDHCVE